MRKTLLIIAVLLSIYAADSRAEEISHQQLVNELIIAFDIEKSTNFDIEKIADIIISSEPQFTAYRDVLIRFFSKYLTWDAVRPMYEEIISREFTNADLLKINIFLMTPAFGAWLKSSGDIEQLSEEDKEEVMAFITSDEGIHFFKIAQELTTASNEFIGKVVLEHKAELDSMMEEKTNKLVE